MHPERHAQFRQRLDDLARWVEQGCFLQVTAGSHLGVFWRSTKASAQELVARGLTRVVASDAHDCKFRRPSLELAHEILFAAHGELPENSVTPSVRHV
jgi:protein-tyrosine phosphatase